MPRFLVAAIFSINFLGRWGEWNCCTLRDCQSSCDPVTDGKIEYVSSVKGTGGRGGSAVADG